MGAVWNFNRVLELASGEYFMWAAHDDLCDPTHVSKCIEATQARPDAVLCSTDISFLYEDGQSLEVPPTSPASGPPAKTVNERVKQIARACNWFDVYGLIRAEAPQPPLSPSKSTLTPSTPFALTSLTVLATRFAECTSA
jgi:hypothetical protein